MDGGRKIEQLKPSLRRYIEVLVYVAAWHHSPALWNPMPATRHFRRSLSLVLWSAAARAPDRSADAGT